MVKAHSPLMSELDNILRLRLKKHIAFRMLDVSPSSDRTGKGQDIFWQAQEEQTAQITGRRTIS